MKHFINAEASGICATINKEPINVYISLKEHYGRPIKSVCITVEDEEFKFSMDEIKTILQNLKTYKVKT